MSHDIGDLHGNADELEALLARMGYRHRKSARGPGVWRHPTRTAIFVGDFIDRGPRQRRTVELVRSMIEVGAALAVMGNHELNAIAWYLPDPARDGEHLRPRGGELGARNRRQHQSFLAEYEPDPRAHRDCIDWFLTLPLWLNLPGLRVVHACWHDGCMAELEPRLAPTGGARTLGPSATRNASPRTGGRAARRAAPRIRPSLSVDRQAGLLRTLLADRRARAAGPHRGPASTTARPETGRWSLTAGTANSV